ncbi:MAG: hypothetical protein EXX96DRAFT_621239 [Benjaminiella poitrasii]|nr:MAG: hypothetical protein EXX96DRAFT_621239 [Benjaminiella poitrasii]
MEPINYDHDSFLFKRRINNNKRNTTANRNKSSIHRKQKTQTNSQQDLPDTLPATIETADLPLILKKYTLYIHKSLQHTTLAAIAEGLGATVRMEMTKSITHLIIDPKGDSRQMRMVNQAVSKGIVCVSPKWLMMCYTDKTLYPPTDFQYDIDESINVLDRPLEPQTSMYNPFSTTYIDYDELEKTRPLEGGQLRLDGFVSRVSANADQSAELVPSKIETMQQDGYDPIGVDDEEEGGMREFYYNHSNNGEEADEKENRTASEPRYQETAEELEARRIRSEQRSLQLQKAIEQRRTLMKQKEDCEKQETRVRRVVPNLYNDKRVHVWYGEHFAQQNKR